MMEKNAIVQEDKLSKFKLSVNRIVKVHLGGVNELAFEDTITVSHEELKEIT